MARKTRQSNAEMFVDIIARLPWWVCVVLALASWIFFRSVANSPLPNVTDLRHVGTGFFLGTWFRGVSFALQFVAPFLCAIAAIVSFVRRKKRVALVANVTASPSADALNGMSWREFEMLVGRTAKKGANAGEQFWGCSRFPACYGTR